MAKTFAQALREQCEQGAFRKRKAARILKFLDSPPSSAKARRLRRMEDRVAGALGLSAAKIDWSKIDWSAVFDKVLEIILKLLPFLLV